MNGTQNNAPHEGGQIHIEQCYGLVLSFQSNINLKYTIKMKKNYSNSGSITVNNSFVETWTCTNQLRWKQVECNMGNGTAMNINELQQLWRSDIGSEKWEAVPFVL